MRLGRKWPRKESVMDKLIKTKSNLVGCSVKGIEQWERVKRKNDLVRTGGNKCLNCINFGDRSLKFIREGI